MKAVKEENAEEDDDDVPGKASSVKSHLCYIRSFILIGGQLVLPLVTLCLFR